MAIAGFLVVGGVLCLLGTCAVWWVDEWMTHRRQRKANQHYNQQERAERFERAIAEAAALAEKRRQFKRSASA